MSEIIAIIGVITVIILIAILIHLARLNRLRLPIRSSAEPSNRYNPTGLNRMNMNGMSEDQFIAHAKRARYLSCLVIDANHMARRLYDEAGVLYPISRIYNFDPRPDNDDPTHVKAYAQARYRDLQNLRRDAKSPNALYNIQNERGFEKRDFMMFCELIKLSVADPEGVIGLVFWNGASGAVMTGFWGQKNQWADPYAIEFLRLMHKYREKRLPSGAYAFILGVHNYTSQYSLIAVNAGQNRKYKGMPGDLWDAHNAFLDGSKYVDWRLAQDHIGRDYQGIMRALGYEPVDEGRHFAATPDTLRDEHQKHVMCPWLLGTEVGFDNMNDVRDVHKDELIPMAAHVAIQPHEDFQPMSRVEQLKVGRYGWQLWLITLAEWLEKLWLAIVGVFVIQALDTPRGYRSLAKTWAQLTWFPGKAAGYIFGWLMSWNWKVIHSKTEVMIAQIVFCEGWTSQQWLSYLVTGDGDYLAYAESDAARVDIPEHFLRAIVTPPPPPDDDTYVSVPAERYTELISKEQNFDAEVGKRLALITTIGRISRNLITARTMVDAALNQMQAPLIEFANIAEELDELTQETQ